MIQTTPTAANVAINADNIKRVIFEATGQIADVVRPTDFERLMWLSIKNSIKPHLYGTMPAVVQQTYAYEQESQREYRKKVYRSKSHALLMQSIQDVHKIAQSDDFVVQFGDEVAAVLDRVFFGGAAVSRDVVKKVFSTIYKDRVLDPNGYVGILPYNFENDTVGRKWYELEMYPSENIVARSRDLVIIAIAPNVLRIYTPNAILHTKPDGEPLGVPFIHNSGDLGVYQLGGVPMDIEVNAKTATMYAGIYTQPAFLNKTLFGDDVTRVVEVQMSDYSYSVDELDRLENRNSQNEVVTTLHVHPRIVARDMGCDACDGLGEVQALDAGGAPVNRIIENGTDDGTTQYIPVMHTCKKCDGRGVLNIGTQDVISVPMPTTDMGGVNSQNTSLTDLGNSVLAYITPEITSAEFLYKQLNDCVQNAKEMLRLQRFEDFSESGAAKRIDQEAAQPRLRAIAEGLQTLIRNILRGVVGFEYNTALRSGARNSALSSIIVGLPAFFDLTTVAESKAMYFENIDKKPLFERYLEQRNIVKKQYQSPEQSAIFEFAYNYTNGANLLLQSELVDMNALGVLSTEEVYIAKFIDSFIRRALQKRAVALNPLDITGDDAAAQLTPLVDAERDAALAAMRAQAAARTQAAAALNTPPQM